MKAKPQAVKQADKPKVLALEILVTDLFTVQVSLGLVRTLYPKCLVYCKLYLLI